MLLLLLGEDASLCGSETWTRCSFRSAGFRVHRTNNKLENRHLKCKMWLCFIDNKWAAADFVHPYNFGVRFALKWGLNLFIPVSENVNLTPVRQLRQSTHDSTKSKSRSSLMEQLLILYLTNSRFSFLFLAFGKIWYSLINKEWAVPGRRDNARCLLKWKTFPFMPWNSCSIVFVQKRSNITGLFLVFGRLSFFYQCYQMGWTDGFLA